MQRLSRKWPKGQLEDYVQELEGKIAVLKGKVKILEDTITKVAVKVNKSEQYSLCQNARVLRMKLTKIVAKFVTLCREKFV